MSQNFKKDLINFNQIIHLGLEDFIREFLGNYLSQSTKRSYLKDLSNFFSFLKVNGIKARHPNDITAQSFQHYRDQLIDKKYAPASIHRKLVCIRSFMQWSLAKGLITYNPLDALKLPRISTLNPTQALSDEEAVALIEAPDFRTLSGNTHRLIIFLLLYLGLRRSELTQIQLNHIQEDRKHFVLKIVGKGGKTRLIPLVAKVMNEINRYITTFEQLSGETLGPQDYLIQTSQKGKNQTPCDGATIYRVANRYTKILGINKQIGAHSCRATVISHLLDTQRIPLRDVADFAGHSQTATTERYDKKRKGLDDSAAFKIDFHADKKLS